MEFAPEERSRVVQDLDSHFAKVLPDSLWQGGDGAYIDLRAPEPPSQPVGKSRNRDGFLVVVTPFK